MIENVGGHHQLVGAGAADEIVEPAAHGVRSADDRAAERVIEDRAGVGSRRASKSAAGGGTRPGRPILLFSDACCNDENRNRASSSESAATTTTPSMRWGSASCADARKRSR